MYFFAKKCIFCEKCIFQKKQIPAFRIPKTLKLVEKSTNTRFLWTILHPRKHTFLGWGGRKIFSPHQVRSRKLKKKFSWFSPHFRPLYGYRTQKVVILAEKGRKSKILKIVLVQISACGCPARPKIFFWTKFCSKYLPFFSWVPSSNLKSLKKISWDPPPGTPKVQKILPAWLFHKKHTKNA